MLDEQFHTGERTTQIAVRALLDRSDGPALRKFILQYGIFLAATTLLVMAPVWQLPLWGSAVALLVFGFSVMANFATLHETAHNTAFQSRWLNRMVAWLAAAPFFYTPTGFREFHFAHHRHTHDPSLDPEIAVGGKPAPGVTSNIGMYIGFVSGLPLLLYKSLLLVGASLGGPPVLWRTMLFYVSPRSRGKLSREARIVLVLQSAWIAAGLLYFPGLLVLLAGQVLGHFMLAVYIMAEHNGLPHEGNVLARTRTIRSSAFIRWLMWNMPYHAEHHAYPAVPWHALPQLHRVLAPELKNIESGYLSFHTRVLGMLLRGRSFRS